MGMAHPHTLRTTCLTILGRYWAHTCLCVACILRKHIKGLRAPVLHLWHPIKAYLPPKKWVRFPRKEKVALNYPYVTLLPFSFSLSHHFGVSNLIIRGSFLEIPLTVAFCVGVEAKEGEFSIRHHFISPCVTASLSSKPPLWKQISTICGDTVVKLMVRATSKGQSRRAKQPCGRPTWGENEGPVGVCVTQVREFWGSPSIRRAWTTLGKRPI